MSRRRSRLIVAAAFCGLLALAATALAARGWSSPERISGGDDDVFGPRIALNEAGKGAVAWVALSSDPAKLRVATRNRRGTCSHCRSKAIRHRHPMIDDLMRELERDATPEAAAQVLALATEYFDTTRRGEGPVSASRSIQVARHARQRRARALLHRRRAAL